MDVKGCLRDRCECVGVSVGDKRRDPPRGFLDGSGGQLLRLAEGREKRLAHF